jgi:hypothetical protein
MEYCIFSVFRTFMCKPQWGYTYVIAQVVCVDTVQCCFKLVVWVVLVKWRSCTHAITIRIKVINWFQFRWEGWHSSSYYKYFLNRLFKSTEETLQLLLTWTSDRFKKLQRWYGANAIKIQWWTTSLITGKKKKQLLDQIGSKLITIVTTPVTLTFETPLTKLPYNHAFGCTTWTYSQAFAALGNCTNHRKLTILLLLPSCPLDVKSFLNYNSIGAIFLVIVPITISTKRLKVFLHHLHMELLWRRCLLL